MSGICPRCKKRCYDAEGQNVAGSWFHNQCFNCAQCHKGLGLPTYVPEKTTNEVYCKSCHGSLFGPGGFGHGTSIGVVTHSAVASGGMTVDGKKTGGAAGGSGGGNFCSGCGAAPGGAFCSSCGQKQ